MKNSGRARVARALGDEVEGKYTFEKGLLVVDVSFKMSDEPKDRSVQQKSIAPGKNKSLGLMVKCTPERGHNALFFIPLEVIIML